MKNPVIHLRVRKEFVENDLVEAVILMPENLFYNTTAPGIILVINKNKKKENVAQEGNFKKDIVCLGNADVGVGNIAALRPG